MTQTMYPSKQGTIPNAFWGALILNFVWINLSEVARYFLLIKPMLHETFPDAAHIAAVSPAIFASWMIWDTILIAAATGFYWMVLRQFGTGFKQSTLGATCFTVTIFGLIWLGVVNMGLVPSRFIWAALPLAWLEQIVAALIVLRAMGRSG